MIINIHKMKGKNPQSFLFLLLSKDIHISIKEIVLVDGISYSGITSPRNVLRRMSRLLHSVRVFIFLYYSVFQPTYRLLFSDVQRCSSSRCVVLSTIVIFFLKE